MSGVEEAGVRDIVPVGVTEGLCTHDKAYLTKCQIRLSHWISLDLSRVNGFSETPLIGTTIYPGVHFEYRSEISVRIDPSKHAPFHACPGFRVDPNKGWADGLLFSRITLLMNRVLTRRKGWAAEK